MSELDNTEKNKIGNTNLTIINLSQIII